MDEKNIKITGIIIFIIVFSIFSIVIINNFINAKKAINKCKEKYGKEYSVLDGTSDKCPDKKDDHTYCIKEEYNEGILINRTCKTINMKSIFSSEGSESII